jgi:4-alpha-glucanotransferase
VAADSTGVVRIAVATAQDLLELGSETRMNTPGRDRGNWSTRPGSELDTGAGSKVGRTV